MVNNRWQSQVSNPRVFHSKAWAASVVWFARSHRWISTSSGGGRAGEGTHLIHNTCFLVQNLMHDICSINICSKNGGWGQSLKDTKIEFQGSLTFLKFCMVLAGLSILIICEQNLPLM